MIIIQVLYKMITMMMSLGIYFFYISFLNINVTGYIIYRICLLLIFIYQIIKTVKYYSNLHNKGSVSKVCIRIVGISTGSTINKS